MALPPFNEINVALCEALGLDASTVKRVTISLSGDGYPSVLVEFSPHWLARHGDETLKAFAQYELRPVEPHVEDVT